METNLRKEKLDDIFKKEFNLDEICESFSTLKNSISSFVGIRNYIAKTDKSVSNIVLNTNVKYEKLVKHDLAVLVSITEEQITNMAAKYSLPVDDAKRGLEELIESFTKNNSKEKTVASAAQTATYEYISTNVKRHVETGDIYISGMLIKKSVIEEGIKKVVNSAPKTIAKNKIGFEFGLKTINFRNYILQNADQVVVGKMILEKEDYSFA